MGVGIFLAPHELHIPFVLETDFFERRSSIAQTVEERSAHWFKNSQGNEHNVGESLAALLFGQTHQNRSYFENPFLLGNAKTREMRKLHTTEQLVKQGT